MRWGMVIDLTKCIGCYGCVVTCKAEHHLPPGVFWGRGVAGEVGTYPNVRKQFLPVLCNHCQEAACEKVCPSGATEIREDGIVRVDYDKCIGCRYCLIACPYQRRTFLSRETMSKGYYGNQEPTELERKGRELYPLQEGTVVKCNFCMERIDQGIEKGLTPGVDREATPACVNECVARARVFGDLDDPESEISRLIRARKARPLHPEFGTDPSVFYIQY
ncbi:MAG: 4Fe-4S dicluster domain-containing protein [Chloroflexi bacterium]|nr:4Fe-4S dicluster domain-containing protein [Chloroflexota bacterium]